MNFYQLKGFWQMCIATAKHIKSTACLLGNAQESTGSGSHPSPLHTRATRPNMASVLQRMITASTRFRLVSDSPVQLLIAHFGALTLRMARAPERAELQLSALPDGGSSWIHVVTADAVMPRGKSVVTNWPIDDAT